MIKKRASQQWVIFPERVGHFSRINAAADTIYRCLVTFFTSRTRQRELDRRLPDAGSERSILPPNLDTDRTKRLGGANDRPVSGVALDEILPT
ncbi:MAG: hypothetical protein ABR530_04320 [Pyrinomonadaceae bacterium]